MYIRLAIICFCLSLMPAFVLAGANHDHGHSHGHSHEPASQDKVEKVALKNVARLVKKGKIDDSWKLVKVSTAKKKKFGRKTEWVVTLKNDKAGDPAKQTLYVFVTLEGKYLAANFTGK